MPSWLGYGTLFIQLDKYSFSFILLTVNLFITLLLSSTDSKPVVVYKIQRIEVN